MFKPDKYNLLLIFTGFIFLTVFIQYDSLMNGLESSKRLFFFFFGSILMLVAGAQLLVNKRNNVGYFNLIDISICAYSVYQFVRLVFTPQTHITNDQFVSNILLLIFYFVIKSHGSNQTSRKVLNYIFLGTGLLQGLFALLQLYGLLDSNSQYFIMTGSFGNPDAFAGFTAPVLVYGFGIYRLEQKDNILKNTALITFIVLLLALAATQIRGGWLAAATGCGFIYLYHRKEFFNKLLNSKIKLIASVMASVTVAVIMIAFLFSVKPDSANGRLLIWKISIGIFTENPVFGIGYDRFAVEYNNVQAKYFSSDQKNDYEMRIAGNVNRAHNEYLEILVELGLTGFILFIFVITSVFFPQQHSDEKEDNAINKSAKAALSAILLFSLSSFPFHILPSQINLFFLLGILSSQVKIPIYIIRSGKFIKAAAPAMLIIAAILINITVKQYHNYTYWDKAMGAAFYGNYNLAEKIFAELEPELKNNGEFLFNYGGMLSLAGKHEKAIEKLKAAKERFTNPNLYISLGNSYAAKGNYGEAEKNYLHAINMIPHKLYQKYLLAKLYVKTGQINKSLSLAYQIIDTPEKVRSQAATEIRSEMKTLIEKFSKY